MSINALPEAKTQQLSQAYQVYRAGTKKLYSTDQLPILRSRQPTTFSRINST
ncbi:hypothetical protein QT995_23735 [Microcoleus sp. S36b_A3]|uniref:hypothetical protein n=1 Tax=unclassified Microcoleus TaxID=2642155 RepID=UPI002FCF723E